MKISNFILRQINNAVVALLAILIGWSNQVLASDGTVIGNLAEQMSPGSWAELPTQNSQLLNATDFIFEFSDKMVWDPVTRRTYFLGSSDPNQNNGDMKFLSYDAATNSWIEQPDPFFAPQAGQGITHGYQHIAIDVTHRRLYYKPFGTSPRMYSMNLDSGVWTQAANIVNDSSWITNAAALSYFPERDKLYFHNSETDGRVRQLHEYTYGAGNMGGSWAYFGAGLTPSASNHPVMIYNPVHGVMWYGGGDETSQMWKLDAAGTITKLAPTPSAVSALRTSGASHASGSVITVDPVSGDFLVLAGSAGGGGGDKFWKYDIISDTWTQLSGSIPPFSGYPGGGSVDMSFYTTAASLDTYGVIMVVQYDDDGPANKVWLYKHADGGTPPPPPPPPPGGSGGSMTFQEVLNQPSTLSGWDFETPGHGTEADLFYGPAGSDSPTLDNFLSNHQNGYPNYGGYSMQSNFNVSVTDASGDGTPMYPKRDSTVSEFPGGTSMKFTITGDSNQKAGGDLIIPFKRFGTEGNYTFAQFGPGGEFWVRYAMRQDQQLISESDFYTRAGGGHQGGAKRLIIHGTASAGSLEETLQDIGQRRIPQMYSDAGSEIYNAQAVNGCYENDDIVANDFDNPANYPEPPCRKFKADTWTTYHIHVKVADNAQRNNGLVELFMNDETDPVIRVTDADHSGTTLTQPYIETGTWDSSGGDEKGYGKLSFTLWATNKAPTPNIPDAHMWIDNVIVSKERVPTLMAPGTISDTLSPANATGLIAR